jgi:hypothetical protein
VFKREEIGFGKLLLNVSNYRIVPQTSQPAARDAIIKEQGKKLLVLGQDICDYGLNPFDLPLVVKNDGGDYVVIEGNRRMTTIALLHDPELCVGAAIHAGFVKLKAKYPNSAPSKIVCAIAPDRKSALMWSNRKHASELGGKGTEPWLPMAKARANADQGNPEPGLDVVNFVLADTALDPKLREHLQGSSFSLSTLERLITTKELQKAADLVLDKGILTGSAEVKWTRKVFSDLVGAIHDGEWKGKPFTVRDIDKELDRVTWVNAFIKEHPGKKVASGPWNVKAKPVKAAPIVVKVTKKVTPSLKDQPNLIPKPFKLALPAGKINEIFGELKKLDIEDYPNAVSVLFRVFLDLTLDEYIKKNSIALPIKKGTSTPDDKLSTRITLVIKHVKDNNVMTQKELIPINAALNNSNSLLASETLNAYVHSKWMNPDPNDLKKGWINIQPFIDKLWA